MADAGVKAMMPFGRPFLDFALHTLAEAGVTDVCIVIGPEHEIVRRHYGEAAPTRLTISFAEQAEPRGTADAVAAAQPFTGAEPFLAVNGDNLYPVEACRTLCACGEPALAAFTRTGLLRDGLIAADRVSAFAVVRAHEGYLQRIIEKPDAAWVAGPGADLPVSMNCWLLGPSIFEAVRTLPLSPRGELELPLAVQALVDQGERFRVFVFDAPVLDLSRRSDVATLHERLRGHEIRL
jgi:glucose-1-phosphate thymidylyltransferase